MSFSPVETTVISFSLVSLDGRRISTESLRILEWNGIVEFEQYGLEISRIQHCGIIASQEEEYGADTAVKHWIRPVNQADVLRLPTRKHTVGLRSWSIEYGP